MIWPKLWDENYCCLSVLSDSFGDFESPHVQFEMKSFSLTIVSGIRCVTMFLKLGKQRSRKKTWERAGEKEIWKQHENEGVKGNALQFILPETVFLSWHQPKVGQLLGHLPRQQKALSQSRAGQPLPFLWWISVVPVFTVVLSSSFCLIIFLRATGHFGVCVSDTMKPSMIAIQWAQLPDPPGALGFLVELWCHLGRDYP